MHNAVIVFAKYPRPGSVKTRLAAAIGDEGATGFYRECAEHLFNQVSSLASSTPVHLFCSDAADLPAMQQWTRNQFVMHTQQGNDLGERMFNAFTEVFQSGAGRVAIVGTDIPELTAMHIDQAFTLLDDHDVVIGPARDGGYYLLAMKSLRNIFGNIQWSTPTVADETRSQIAAEGISMAELEELDDVDTAAQYLAIARHLRTNG